MSASDSILEHYARFDEDVRLSGAFGEFECTRLRELIARYLPDAPADVIDVGGGTGAHAFWLAGLGHRVHLIDLVPRHIEMATTRQASSASPLASIAVGDARQLTFPDRSADVVVLAGPLYHLIEREQRIRALRESYRVLRPGGILLAVAINRYAGLIYGLTEGRIFDGAYFEMTVRELTSGVRTSPPADLNTFAEAYFHLPAALIHEVSDAGFACDACLGVVGPAWQVPDLRAAWADASRRELLLSLARRLEPECMLSPQLFCAARRQG